MIAQGQFTIVDLNDITTQAIAPDSPTVNMLWFDTTNNVLKRWTGSQWVVYDGGLNSFIQGEYAQDMEALEAKIDTLQEIWFYSGTPTLSNPPVSTWDISDYSKHVGDMYYDTSTGYAYRFKSDSGVFSWEQVQDQDAVEALALANAASDTADSKRRVFMAEPTPPYDNGDLWLNNQEIYVCQISKDEGTFEDNDFIVATKYTDDTVANRVGDNLEVVRGSVTTIQQNQDAFKVEIETQIKTINDLQEETIESLDRMSYTFTTDDLAIAKSTDPINTRINNQGLKVYNYNSLQALFNHKGTGVQKLIVVGDTQLANLRISKAIDEDGNDCTDVSFLVSNIQSLSDLE